MMKNEVLGNVLESFIKGIDVVVGVGFLWVLW